MTTLITPQPWHQQCPVDIQRLINNLDAIESYLRPRAASHQQRCIIGQITFLRRYLPDFSDQPLPARRPTGKYKKLLRQRVLDRDGHRCVNCGSTETLEMHHVIPLSQGGTNHLDNLQTLCNPCHATTHTITDL